MLLKFTPIIIPLLSVYFTYYLVKILGCNNFESNTTIPSYIFPIVWPTLLLLTGISWYLSKRNRKCKRTNLLYISLTLSLALYIPLALCYSVNNFLLLNVLRILTFFILLHQYNTKCWESLLTIIPLFTWIMIVAFKEL